MYGSAGQIGRMWDSLNPRTRSFNLRDALRYFELAWRGRGGHLRARYQERHRLRIGMFRRGIEHMEYCLRRPTAAVRAKRYPAYPAANAGIIGVYRSETDAVNEKATDRAWRARAEWECWIQKRSRAIGTYIYDNTIVGIYRSAQDARHDGVETLEITRATETAAVQRAMANLDRWSGVANSICTRHDERAVRSWEGDHVPNDGESAVVDSICTVTSDQKSAHGLGLLQRLVM